MSVIKKLAERRGFTAAEKELADYLLSHADEVSHMGLADVAAACCKSNGTILRLCRKVGSTGWREFRVDFTADLERARRTSRAIDPNTPFSSNSSTQAIMNGIAALKREALEDCYASIDEGQVQALAEAMSAARRVIFYANGDSYATALAFGAQLSKLGISCVPADQYRFINESAYHATEQDLALFVSYSGSLVPEHEQIPFETLRKRRCKIAIVTSLASVADRFSGFDYPLVVPNRENRYGKISTFYSQTCLRYAFDCIYSVIFCGNYASNLLERELIERLEPGLSAERVVR
ncbi:MAG: MurR/RpiR family transcriptional regulator [Coriobacteriales bacterium]|nr:MurR/RpiR family transcriptional regulator [Coriobacteriales bacterium]